MAPRIRGWRAMTACAAAPERRRARPRTSRNGSSTGGTLPRRPNPGRGRATDPALRRLPLVQIGRDLGAQIDDLESGLDPLHCCLLLGWWECGWTWKYAQPTRTTSVPIWSPRLGSGRWRWALLHAPSR